MPNNVAGRKARCNSCGFIFTVPSLDLNPPAAPARPKPAPPASARPASTVSQTEPETDRPDAEPGSWLAEFAREEGKSAPTTPTTPERESENTPPIAVSSKAPQDEDDDEEWYPSSGRRPKTIDFVDDNEEARRLESLAVRSEDESQESEDATEPSSAKPREQDDDDDEWYPSSGRRPKLIDFADGDPDEEPAATLVPDRPQEIDMHAADEERSGVIEPTRPYWIELASSFLFFLDTGSFITFIIIILINVLTVPLTYAGPVSMLTVGVPWGFLRRSGSLFSPMTATVGLGLISGYLCTFYMTVILETAAGEDELPNVWISNVFEDVVVASLRFAGTVAWVMLPASFVAIIEYINLGQIHWNVVWLLAAAGLVFWPVVVLGVSVGGGFYGLWPLRIIRTAAAAPLAYLAMCVVLLIAAAIAALPYLPVYRNLLGSLAGLTNRSFLWLFTVVNSTISAYAAIVAMRAIGLYYRHYKRKFPWVAE
jgi:hypothetical protein